MTKKTSIVTSPQLQKLREAVRNVPEPSRGPVTAETVNILEKAGFYKLAEIARMYSVDRPRWWHRFIIKK